MLKDVFVMCNFTSLKIVFYSPSFVRASEDVGASEFGSSSVSIINSIRSNRSSPGCRLHVQLLASGLTFHARSRDIIPQGPRCLMAADPLIVFPNKVSSNLPASVTASWI
jgi:hypothetical protein